MDLRDDRDVNILGGEPEDRAREPDDEDGPARGEPPAGDAGRPPEPPAA